MREKKIFLHIWMLQRIALYKRRQKIRSLDTIEFLDTHVYKQTTLTKQWNYNIFVQILYNYFRYTGRLFLGCAVFVACCNIISFMRNQEGIKIELQKKVHRRICVRDITFLTARSPFYVIFCCFLHLLPFLGDVLAESSQ